MMIFNYLKRSIIKCEIDFFRTYLSEMEQVLKRKGTILEQEWKTTAGKGKNLAEYQDHLIECNHELQRGFEIFYFSFIITIFAFLEHKLNEICRILSIKNKFKITLKDINGRGIYRAKTFMEKICNLDLPGKNLWQKLKKINEIRNCLIHSNAEINKNNEELISYTKKLGKIKIEENCTTKIKTIKITKEYCSFAIGIIEEYLLTLIDKNTKGERRG